MRDKRMEFEGAERRGEQSLRSEPRARRARYDRKTGRVLVELTNGCSFAFPARRAEGLEDASNDELAEVTILGLGLGLHWERLDVDLSVPGLLAGLFGTKLGWTVNVRRARARQHRRRKPPPHVQTARRGGRPRKANAKRPRVDRL